MNITFKRDNELNYRDGKFYCGACGKRIRKKIKARYCPKCGRKIEYVVVCVLGETKNSK